MAMLLAIFYLFVITVQGIEIDYDAQLRFINKPPLKSFKTEYGDIIDCIDIYKQLAFDHPLLKNHTIQMRPKTSPKKIESETSSKRHKDIINYMAKTIKCPPNSVPIKRTTREDLIMAQSVKPFTLNQDYEGHELGLLVNYRLNFGAKGVMNVWKPSIIDKQQYSIGRLAVQSGPLDKVNMLVTGWRVTLEPNISRSFISWTGDGYKTGCFNTQCPGFVQVDKEVTLDLALPVSTFNGAQTETTFSLYQDRATQNWWLMINDKYIGYWPKELLPLMIKGAELSTWGGEVYSPIDVVSPEMGSGHFPEEGYAKAAYITHLQVITQGTTYEDPKVSDLKLFVNKDFCYNAKFDISPSRWGFFMFYGGPGHCTF